MLLGASTLVFYHNPPIRLHEVLVAVEAYKPSWTYLPPNILESIAEYLQENAYNGEENPTVKVLRGIKACMSGGAPVRKSTAEYLRSQGINLTVGYGASGKQEKRERYMHMIE